MWRHTRGKRIGRKVGKRIENGAIKSNEEEPREYRQSVTDRTSEKTDILLFFAYEDMRDRKL
jgi:hypothetical protein